MIAVLFARLDSIYKELPGCDVYDIQRDARTFRGGSAIVAHPPCRAWGRLRTFARPAEGERELAHFAVDVVRRFGGVLEHPAGSLLWKSAGLPEPGRPDDLPPIPFVLGEATHVVQSRKRGGHRPHITKAEREHTPKLLAEWLVKVAEICGKEVRE